VLRPGHHQKLQPSLELAVVESWQILFLPELKKRQPRGDLISRRRSPVAVANATFRAQATTPDVGETPTAGLLFRRAKKFLSRPHVPLGRTALPTLKPSSMMSAHPLAGSHRAHALDPEWLRYAQAAERLSATPHAVWARATRNGWRRQTGNDGRARILVALEPRSPDEPPMSPRSSPAHKAADPALVHALEAISRRCRRTMKR
jgi:hypothetical protein